MDQTQEKKQRLHLVFGGELTTLTSVEFRDLSKLDIVGIFPDYETRSDGLEIQGADDGRQRPYALFHRPHAPDARSGKRLMLVPFGSPASSLLSQALTGASRIRIRKVLP